MKIATCSRDKIVRIWDSHTGKLEKTLLHNKIVNSVAFLCEHVWVVLGSVGNIVWIWDLDIGDLKHKFKGYKGAVNSVMFLDKEIIVASALDNGNVFVWDTILGKLQHKLKGHIGLVTYVAFYKTNYNSTIEWITSGSHDHTVGIWDTSTGKLLQILSGYTDWIISIVIDEDILATSSVDQTVILWE